MKKDYSFLASLGKKGMQVYFWIGQNTSNEGYLIATTREIAEKSNVSHKTALDTMSILKAHGVVKMIHHGAYKVDRSYIINAQTKPAKDPAQVSIF